MACFNNCIDLRTQNQINEKRKPNECPQSGCRVQPGLDTETYNKKKINAQAEQIIPRRLITTPRDTTESNPFFSRTCHWHGIPLNQILHEISEFLSMSTPTKNHKNKSPIHAEPHDESLQCSSHLRKTVSMQLSLQQLVKCSRRLLIRIHSKVQQGIIRE